MNNNIKNKKLCEISKGIPFLESIACKGKLIEGIETNSLGEIQSNLTEIRNRLKIVKSDYFKDFNITDFYESIFPKDKSDFVPKNLIFILIVIVVILFLVVLILTISKSIGRNKKDVVNMLKLYEFPIPPPPPPPPVNFVMSNEIAPMSM
jgi:ATP-dependent Zn protease